MLDTVLTWRRNGLCVLPALLAEKRPALPSWKQYQSRLPTERQLASWFAQPQPLCILTGSVSGNLEVLDFDQQAEAFEPWKELVRSHSPGLFERLVIERTQSGGRHVIYRCRSPVTSNHKLAQRQYSAAGPEPEVVSGKQHVPRRFGEDYLVTVTLIETRGEGGLFLCAPTPGYCLEQGSFDELPVLNEAEHQLLIQAARALNDVLPTPACHHDHAGLITEGRPGDDFNRYGDIREILLRHGWQLVRGGDNEYWRRPGKDSGWSATLKDGVFYVFSSNAAPFEPEHAYPPFSVLALLDHGGDFSAAAAALRNEGYGEMKDALSQVDLSRICGDEQKWHNEPKSILQDPGTLPVELYRVPGFISEVMDHCLATAPYPNPALAFCGALALQAVLAGRKVRDDGDNRTNLYILALGFSSAGKDWPRKLNTHILHRVGLIDALGEKFASGEGLQDALFLSPAMLFQTDEIDGLLQSINKSHDARHENLLGTLLTMYSAANTVYPMRRKAGKDSPGVIDQPCLVVYGTAIPTHYYAALSERMLTNGFFARMLVVESGRRGAGQNPGIINPSSRVMVTAKWWADLNPVAGNLDRFYPQPLVVPADRDAEYLLGSAREGAEHEYTLAEAAGDPVSTTVWGRAAEQIRKLALIYAVSANHKSPCINAPAMRWATDFVLHQTRRMLFMAQSHVAENPFHADCLKLLQKLREAPGRTLPHSVLLKRMKTDSKSFAALVETVRQQGELEIVSETRSGWATRSYRLTGGES